MKTYRIWWSARSHRWWHLGLLKSDGWLWLPQRQQLVYRYRRRPNRMEVRKRTICVVETLF